MPSPTIPPTHRILYVLLIAVALLWLALPGGERWYITCPLHRLTGWDCPLCGGQRMVHELLHGRLQQAFGYNPLLFVTLPFMALWFFRQCFPDTSSRHPRLTGACLFSRKACRLYLLLAVSWGIVRNLIHL